MVVSRGLAGLVVALVTGCASTPPWPDTEAGRDQVQPVQIATPFFPQERYQCGPAALAAMLVNQDVSVNPDDLIPQVYIPEREGSLKVELVAAARRYGLLVYPLEGGIADVLTEIDAGHPVLVMQNLGFDWFAQWHFAVVVGYDADAQELILHTDTRRANRQPLSVFFRTWDRADQWAAVMLRPDTLPATAQPLRYLEAASDLEVTSQLAAARTAYQTAVSRWPDEPAAWLGIGNIDFHQNRWVQAADQYHATVEAFPDLAPGWNNLAHALARSGCASAAGDALMCANSLSDGQFPSDLPDQASAAEMSCPEIACPTENDGAE